jgi:hypothetical protein
MKLVRGMRFERSYSAAPERVQRAFDKQSLLLTQNLHHPLLRAKKYDESRDLWQARVNRNWRSISSLSRTYAAFCFVLAAKAGVHNTASHLSLHPKEMHAP